ncbi:MAG: hypothetical protein FWG10_07730 [Eubacteriaceae bacterium]|nr:hypothetical protein [Eubacteriaceae bacterium]
MAIETFKKPGAAEYCNDVFIDLQLTGVGSNGLAWRNQRRRPATGRACEYENRNGRTVEKMLFDCLHDL